jgi:hypothetical protein
MKFDGDIESLLTELRAAGFDVLWMARQPGDQVVITLASGAAIIWNPRIGVLWFAGRYTPCRVVQRHFECVYEGNWFQRCLALRRRAMKTVRTWFDVSEVPPLPLRTPWEIFHASIPGAVHVTTKQAAGFPT